MQVTRTALSKAAASFRRRARAGRAATAYVAVFAMVAFATLVAAASERVVQTSGVALLFVLPVLLAAAAFGWWPAFAAVLGAAASFDFFFTEPRFQLVISKPEDIWTLILLLIVASIASMLAANARRHGHAAKQAADRAGRLHDLAHAALGGDAPAAFRSAARALASIFASPAVVLEEVDYDLKIVGASGSPQLSAKDLEAARWCASQAIATRAETFPFPESRFDFWPVTSMAGTSLVLGFQSDSRGEGRPVGESQSVELVAGYVAAAAGPRLLRSPVSQPA